MIIGAESVRLVVPGTWWALDPQKEPELVEQEIHRHVERVVGREDQRATLRRDIRQRLSESVRGAREIGASSLMLADSIAPGVPFPATLLIIDPRVTIPLGDTEAQAGVLRLWSPDGGTPQPVAVADFAVVRTISERGGAAVGSGIGGGAVGSGSVDALAVTYLAASLADGRLAVFAFSCPLLILREQLLELFDAIVSTVRFPGTIVTAPATRPT